MKFEIDAGAKPSLLILEGLDCQRLPRDELAEIKALAEELAAEVWISSPVGEETVASLPAPLRRFEDLVSVVLALEPGDGVVALRALKDHDNPDLAALHVSLDPRTPAAQSEADAVAAKLRELVAVLAAQGVRLGAREAELLGDRADHGGLDPRDRSVRGGDGVQALQQLRALLAGRDAAELARDDVVVGVPQHVRLRLGDLHRQRRLSFRERGERADDALHLGGLGLDDREVGVGDARQHVGEAREVFRGGGLEALELRRDPAHARRVPAFARLLPDRIDPEEPQERHARLRAGDGPRRQILCS